MAINFPDAPTSGDIYTIGDKTWTFDGTAWNLVTSSGSDHGNLGGLGDDDHTQYLLADGTRTATELTISGDLTVDTDTLYVDAANDRVGINDATPSYALDVTGDINATGDLCIGGTAIGTWQNWTPTVTQGATTFTLSVNGSRYTEINDVVIAVMRVTLSGTGVAGNSVYFTLPATPKSEPLGLGNGLYYDASVPYLYLTQVSYDQGTAKAGLLSEGSNGNFWGVFPNIAAATSDQMRFTLVYEKA
jgi:hypothetical protein